jgi:hypothetical protein
LGFVINRSIEDAIESGASPEERGAALDKTATVQEQGHLKHAPPRRKMTASLGLIAINANI